MYILLLPVLMRWRETQLNELDAMIVNDYAGAQGATTIQPMNEPSLADL